MVAILNHCDSNGWSAVDEHSVITFWQICSNRFGASSDILLTDKVDFSSWHESYEQMFL